MSFSCIYISFFFFTKHRDIILLYWKHLQIITMSFPCIYTFGQSQSQVFGPWQLFPAFLQDRCYLLLGLLNINYATLRSNYKQLNNGDVIELEQRLILLTFSHSLDFTFSCLSMCSSVSPALLLLISLKTIFLVFTAYNPITWISFAHLSSKEKSKTNEKAIRRMWFFVAFFSQEPHLHTLWNREVKNIDNLVHVLTLMIRYGSSKLESFQVQGVRIQLTIRQTQIKKKIRDKCNNRF